MQFAGDITPSQGVSHAPCLSDFLTIGDLMNCIGELYNTEDGNRVPDSELVEDKGIMDHYFRPDLHDQVRRLYTEANTAGGAFAPGFNLPSMEDMDL